MEIDMIFFNIVNEFKNDNLKLKEYKNGKLLFKGEYINSEKNGKGKEYYNDG